MQTFTYKALGAIQSTEPQPIFNDRNEQVLQVVRVYDNSLKKLFDGYFDYRYFLKYRVTTNDNTPIFEVKKIFRRGKVWFEGRDVQTGEHYIINYENWRIGVPELFVNGQQLKMKIDKEMEGWSNFIVDEVVIARWLPVYDEAAAEFTLTFELSESAPIQNPAFYIAIAQATLFIGV